MMTEAPIPGLIGRLAVPTIISMLITSFYNMADTFFVGRIGTSATAAVGVAFPLMAVIQALGFFCGHGSGNSISRRLGSKDADAAGQLAATGFFLALFLGFAVMALGLIFLKPLCIVLGSTKTILPYTEQYLGIILIGAPYMTAQLVLNNQIRFQGNAFYSMVGITIGAVLNIALDPLFIFVFHMGISGAAIATILSQFVSFILLLAGIRISGCIPIRFRNVRFRKERLREILGGGLPSLFRQGLGSVATMTLNIAANPYGDAAIAAMSIVSRITMFASSALIGFGQGFQPVCGFNYGAKKYGRVREAFWFCVKVSTVVLFVLAVTGALLSGHLVGIFRNDSEVIRIGTTALRFQCLTFILNGWIIMNNMMMQTMGKTGYASVLASARQGLFFIPALLILPPLFGLFGIQMAQAVADACTFAITTVLYRIVMKQMRGEEFVSKTDS
ncbi:MATE family efflux transporter [Eubacterium sp. am_0171]|nr:MULTISPECIES: MATE family efflux transporter [unclassified Eubacterium (in: firmicutes)]MBS6765701.1 MATE family efflux transporter [Clostridium sp.]MDU7706125.1 MATE family efflux transporter [Clostridium sp.]MSC82416.1 MATE family efflux transporter [Eubacterium sp. BIOML-A1]MSD04786.1 MATE family efflux transporter [Eubacterium sp. BIOML-A2]RYT25606.1 MATE family efflux transporter [Eubacterium sp. am_0171]